MLRLAFFSFVLLCIKHKKIFLYQSFFREENAYKTLMRLKCITKYLLYLKRGRCVFSPKKRAPRNAKNRRGKGIDYPFEIDEEFEVDIVDVTPNGEGIAKIKGFPVFIGNAKLNEHVKIKITEMSQRLCRRRNSSSVEERRENHFKMIRFWGNWCGHRDLNPGRQLGKLMSYQLDYDRKLFVLACLFLA